MNLALAIKVVEGIAGIYQLLDWTQRRCSSVDLQPLLDESAEALNDAMATLGQALKIRPAWQSPEFIDDAPTGIYAKPPLPRKERSAQSAKRAQTESIKAFGDLAEDEEETEEEADSVWDPEPPCDTIEVSRCRALLLEIIRRAAHDWVLYRQHERLAFKQIAECAYTWLFEEDVGHPWWELRQEEGRLLTGFVSICEILDLDPEAVRERVREMTIKDIMGAGRPAERRQVRAREGADDTHYLEHELVVDFDVGAAGDSNNRSSYENHYATHTPGYL